jgi:cell division protein FtsW
MIITLNIKCKYFKLFTPVFLGIAFFSLIFVFIAGHSTNGAQRWISILGMQFQPSEIAKGAMILAEAQILSAMQTERGADKKAFGYILIVSAFHGPSNSGGEFVDSSTVMYGYRNDDDYR